LVERLLYTQDVGGSSPSPPTNLREAAKIVRRSFSEGGLPICLQLDWLASLRAPGAAAGKSNSSRRIGWRRARLLRLFENSIDRTKHTPAAIA
jgi:hypothetical protein